MLWMPVFIFTSISLAILGCPLCGLSIWLSLLVIQYTFLSLCPICFMRKWTKKPLNVRHFMWYKNGRWRLFIGAQSINTERASLHVSVGHLSCFGPTQSVLDLYSVSICTPRQHGHGINMYSCPGTAGWRRTAFLELIDRFLSLWINKWRTTGENSTCIQWLPKQQPVETDNIRTQCSNGLKIKLILIANFRILDDWQSI